MSHSRYKWQRFYTKHDMKHILRCVCVCVWSQCAFVSWVFLWTVYLLHRPAPGPSPCPLHTQQNSGRSGKKPTLRSRSSSTSLRGVRAPSASTQRGGCSLLMRLIPNVLQQPTPQSRRRRRGADPCPPALTDPRCGSDGAQEDPPMVNLVCAEGGGGCVQAWGREGGREETKTGTHQCQKSASFFFF